MQKTLLLLAVLSALASSSASEPPSAPTSVPERVEAWNGARVGHAGGPGAASPKVVRRHLRHRRRLPDIASLIPGLNLASSLWAGEFTTIPVTQPAERSSSARNTRGSDNGGQRTQGSNGNRGDSSSGGDQRRTSNRASSTYGNGNNNGNTQGANGSNSRSQSSENGTSRTSSNGNGGAGAASTTASRTRSSASPTSSSRAATTVVTSTDTQGASQGNSVVTSQVSVTGTPTSQPAQPQKKENHTGLIAGVSTAGGVVLLAIIGVVIAKLFGRRIVRSFRNDEIKWPEMQQDATAPHAPLPARQTGGAGFDMGGESDDEGNERTMHDDSFKPAESFGNGSLLQGSAPAMQPVQYPADETYMQGVGAGGDAYTSSYVGTAPPTTHVEGLVPGAVVSHASTSAPRDATGAEVPAALQPAHARRPSAKGSYAAAAVPQQYLDVDQSNSYETYSQATDQHGYPVSAIAEVYGDAPPYAETETHYGVAAHDIYDAAGGSPYEADAYVPHSYANSSAHHHG